MEVEQIEVLNFISQYPPFDDLPEERLKRLRLMLKSLITEQVAPLSILVMLYMTYLWYAAVRLKFIVVKVSYITE